MTYEALRVYFISFSCYFTYDMVFLSELKWIWKSRPTLDGLQSDEVCELYQGNQLDTSSHIV